MAKSWDIQPNRVPARTTSSPAQPKAASTTPRRFDDIRQITSPGKKKRTKKAHSILMPMPFPSRHETTRRPVRTPQIPLGRKRKLRRKRLLVLLGCVLLVAAICVDIILWQSWFRVNDIRAEGPSAEAIQTFAQKEIGGTRFMVVPKNSIFFLPTKELRAHILAAFPDAEAISIHPAGLRTLTITATPRAAVAWWCGSAPGDTSGCYDLDAQGLVFAPVKPEDAVASTSMLSIYAPLAGAHEGASPLGGTLAHADGLPKLLEFVKAIRSLNANIVTVIVRGDEADLMTPANTRITYVIGRESQAATLAASAFPDLNLNDGSLLYVDLRFDNKVYFKKK